MEWEVELIDFPKIGMMRPSTNPFTPVFGAMALLSVLNQSRSFFAALGQCKFKQHPAVVGH